MAFTGFPTLSPVTEVIVEIDTKLSYAVIRWDYSFGYKNITRPVIFWCTSETKLPDVVKCKVCFMFQIYFIRDAYCQMLSVLSIFILIFCLRFISTESLTTLYS